MLTINSAILIFATRSYLNRRKLPTPSIKEISPMKQVYQSPLVVVHVIDDHATVAMVNIDASFWCVTKNSTTAGPSSCAVSSGVPLASAVAGNCLTQPDVESALNGLGGAKTCFIFADGTLAGSCNPDHLADGDICFWTPDHVPLNLFATRISCHETEIPAFSDQSTPDRRPSITCHAEPPTMVCSKK